MEEDNLIFGMRSVLEALEAGKDIEKILIQKGLSNELYNQLRRALRGQTVPIQFVPPEKLKRIADASAGPAGKNHQGVIAYLTEIIYYATDELLSAVFEQGRTPLVLILDRVTDVRNFGAVARSAECAGVDFIIIPSRGAAQINGDAIKTSAGALHRIKVCREDNLKTVIESLKASGLQVVSCHEKTENLIYDADFKKPTAIIVGSEENGISSEYLKRSDVQVKIPMTGKIASLNVSVASGIVLFEVLRQRL